MQAQQTKFDDPVIEANREVLSRIEAGYSPRNYAVRYWDQGERPPEPGQSARFTLVLNHPGSVRRMFWPPGGSTLGEAYIYGDFDIEGDMDAYMDFLGHIQHVKHAGLPKLQLVLPGVIRHPSRGRVAQFHAAIFPV